MGCKFSCCIKKPRKRKIEAPWESLLCDLEPDEKRQANKPDTFKDIIYPVSTPNNLQHISDREEAENVDNDPSLHPTFNPLFIQRSRSDMRHMQEKPKSRSHLLETRPLKKSSSCSTIYLDDSTVSHPNYKNTIKCVTMAIYYHIQNRTSNNILDIFDEELHPLSDDPVIDDKIGEPDPRSLYRFIWNLFNATQLSPECAIITLVYLERLLTYAEVDIGPSTWKRMVLGAILLASKVWDDQAIWNHDYCMLFKNLTNNDLNDLERHFLQMLQFNTNVPSSVYAKYYFELRTLAAENDLKFNYELLDKERAQRVEAMSKLCDKPLNGIRQWSSDESISFKRRSKAIIS